MQKGICTFSKLGRYGRFANQIFQIAGTVGMARANGLDYAFPLWINYDHKERFGSTEDANVFDYFINRLPLLEVNQISWNELNVPWGYHNYQLNKLENYDVSGHMQSPKYFNHCLDEVRQLFTMKGEYKGIHDVVAIHARRGDYDNKYHPVVPVGYYTVAISRLSKNSTFFVFSDDNNFINELREALDNYGLYSQAKNLVPVTLDYLESFAVMKRCRHFIIGNSSYSAAAAILSPSEGKVVIAPKNWFGPSYTNITAKDIYSDNWLIM